MTIHPLENYFDSQLASTHGWHEEANDPWPWLTCFVDTVATAYDTFESRAASNRTHGTKQDRVRDYVLHHADSIFRIADIRAALPGVSDQTIRLALDSLKAEILITPENVGRGAVWRRSPSE